MRTHTQTPRVSVWWCRKRLEEQGRAEKGRVVELEKQNALLHSSLQSITSTNPHPPSVLVNPELRSYVPLPHLMRLIGLSHGKEPGLTPLGHGGGGDVALQASSSVCRRAGCRRWRRRLAREALRRRAPRPPR